VVWCGVGVIVVAHRTRKVTSGWVCGIQPGVFYFKRRYYIVLALKC
jgi:hypothetical protein